MICDDAKCIRCSTCVVHCPAGILSLSSPGVAKENAATPSPHGYKDRQEITARIVNIRDLAADVKEFDFQFVKPAKVHYKPGQFILVKIQDEPIMFRAYSIYSYGVDGTVVSVAVKRAKNGYGTDILFSEFKVGDQVTLEGPMGDEQIGRAHV